MANEYSENNASSSLILEFKRVRMERDMLRRRVESLRRFRWDKRSGGERESGNYTIA